MCACEVTAGHSEILLLSGRENGKCMAESSPPRLPAQALRTYGIQTIELEQALPALRRQAGRHRFRLPLAESSRIHHISLGGRPGVRVYERYAHELVTLGTRDWCDEIFRATGLERAAAPEIVPTGSVVRNASGH